MVITGLSITISFRSRKNRIGCERRIDISRFTVYPQQLRHLGYITGFQIPPNTCGPGLTIFHYGTIIVGNATLGEGQCEQVNVLFSALTPAHNNITFAASEKLWRKQKSIIRKSTICISCAVRLRIWRSSALSMVSPMTSLWTQTGTCI